MWFFAALFVASFLLSMFLTPKPKIENARASSLNDFKFPRAGEGDPIGRFYGTVKTTSPNTIGVMNFRSEPIKKKVKTGLFSSKKQIIGYKYFIGLNLAVCLGQNIRFKNMWFGKNLVWSDCLEDCVNVATIDLPELYGGQDQSGGVGGQVAFYCGNYDQPQDSYLVTHLGADVPAYVGVAHVVFRDFWFGNSTQIDGISFEVACFTNSLEIPFGRSVMANGLDINPVEALYDIYINDWGNLGIDPSLINVAQWREVADVIFLENNGISLELGSSNTGGDVTKEILRQIGGMIFQDPSTGVIDLKLIRQDYEIDDLPVLTVAEVSGITNYSKKLWEETFNRVRVKYTDRAAGYVARVAIQDDFANIRFQNRIRATEVSMPGIYVGDNANQIAARELANVNVPLFQGELELNRVLTLRPGDPFILVWPEFNVVQMVLRARKMNLGTREDGKVKMTVVQDEFATESTVIGAPVAPIDSGDDYSPTDIDTYVLFELPYWLVTTAGLTTRPEFTQYGVFAAEPGSRSIDFFVFIDEADDDIEALPNAPYSDSAVLVAGILRFDSFTDGIIPEVDIEDLTDPDILVDRDATAVRNGSGMFMLNGELLGYETFTDNLDGSYTLENVHRSLLDSGWTNHALGDRLFFFDGQEGFFETDVAVEPFDVYLIDRTAGGRSLEADATVETLTPVGRMYLPAPPDGVEIEGARDVGLYFDAGDTVTVTWLERNRLTALIQSELDVTETPEADTTYRVELVQGVTVLETQDAIAVATYDLEIPSGAVGGAVVNVWAEREGMVAFSAASFPISIVSVDSLEIDDDPVLIDSETVEF